ncbi:putative Mannose-sensitive agglutinin (MSHA) biogenesis protein MshD (pilus type IV) [marine gamma proteobacterium HTCC2143]|jgi:MSHA pilin protein MshD|uniref:Putative Mannose-sensitive agglutinin (MSHA) biogenesis protein MshD (Pilus type IV) n=1 Tax=marine gamma proteobacterium HTCC2143 TaxID=247633 RepID=A0YA43_9GAMM|nr:putative Mannose-sensitive agglutinin (MSHA) biogenesis protein MshD (pilus type IV) [marine gamma proteobacterium HTCC2143]
MVLQAPTKNSGFTLIELIVGIVIMAIALTFMTNVFFSNPGRSVEPMMQIRAIEFGQALMDEILSKKFDDTTPMGGVPACVACTASGNFGSEAESRSSYDDVDDYHDSCGAPVPLTDGLGVGVSNFMGYTMEVCVSYDGNYDGVADNNINAKLITIKLYLPSGAGIGAAPVTLSSYRGNF